MDPMAAEMMLKPCFMPSPSITYKLPPLSAPMTVCVPAIRAGPADMSKSLSDIDFQLDGVKESSVADNPGGTFTKLWLKFRVPSRSEEHTSELQSLRHL